MQETTKKPFPAAIQGRGYFNSNPGIGAGEAAAIRKAQAPFTTVDGQGRESIDILAEGYAEAISKVTQDYAQPQYKSSGNDNTVWMMPYREREALLQNLAVAGVKGVGDMNAIRANGNRNGYQEALAGLDDKTIQDALDYQAAIADDGSGGIKDTGRYVVLRSPDGTTSKLMMELEPRMDVHRFLDLEAPEGQAQVLELKEGAYDVAWEFEDAPIIQDGIEAARAFQEEFGLVPSTKCGRGDMSVENSELYKLARSLSGPGFGPAEPSAKDLSMAAQVAGTGVRAGLAFDLEKVGDVQPDRFQMSMRGLRSEPSALRTELAENMKLPGYGDSLDHGPAVSGPVTRSAASQGFVAPDGSKDGPRPDRIPLSTDGADKMRDYGESQPSAPRGTSYEGPDRGRGRSVKAQELFALRDADMAADAGREAGGDGHSGLGE